MNRLVNKHIYNGVISFRFSKVKNCIMNRTVLSFNPVYEQYMELVMIKDSKGLLVEVRCNKRDLNHSYKGL